MNLPDVTVLPIAYSILLFSIAVSIDSTYSLKDFDIIYRSVPVAPLLGPHYCCPEFLLKNDGGILPHLLVRGGSLRDWNSQNQGNTRSIADDQEKEEKRKSYHLNNRPSFADVLQWRLLRWSREDERNNRSEDPKIILSLGDNNNRLTVSSSSRLGDDVLIPITQGGKMGGGTNRLAHLPVVCHYYGRSRVRGDNAASSSPNFILIGPYVDDWKGVAQILASRGFNTIAVERLPPPGNSNSNNDDAPKLMLEILDALRWNKAVLVGCDMESILAMEATMMLAPERIAGMVLSGDLSQASRVASEAGVDVLDVFLRRILDCPHLIVWDGDTASIVSSSHDASSLSSTTCQILGGGSSPHQTKSEQYAWVLTRFVEEQIETRPLEESNSNNDIAPRIDYRKYWSSGSSGVYGPNISFRARHFFRLTSLPFGVNTIFSTEGRLLLGRAVAGAIFYITIMKVVVVQYGILREGLIGLRSTYDSFGAVLKRIFQATGAFFMNAGYIKRLLSLFQIKQTSEFDDEDGDSREIRLSSPHDDSSDKDESSDDKNGAEEQLTTEEAPKSDNDENESENDDDDENRIISPKGGSSEKNDSDIDNSGSDQAATKDTAADGDNEQDSENEDQDGDTDDAEEIPRSKPVWYLDSVVT